MASTRYLPNRFVSSSFVNHLPATSRNRGSNSSSNERSGGSENYFADRRGEDAEFKLGAWIRKIVNLTGREPNAPLRLRSRSRYGVRDGFCL